MCPHVAIVVRLLHIGQYLAHDLFLEMGPVYTGIPSPCFREMQCLEQHLPIPMLPESSSVESCHLPAAWFWEKIPGPISVLNVTRWKNWRNFV